MTSLKIGDAAPDFTLPTDSNGTFSLSAHHGKPVIVFFYPKDNTPGCTTEVCAFRDNLEDFNAFNAVVVGISKCSVKKHDNFKAKHNLTFPLASDENGTTCEDYGVWLEKSMYGKKFMGIQRSTFLIAPDGTIAALWPKVKVSGHVDEVKQALRDLYSNST